MVEMKKRFSIATLLSILSILPPQAMAQVLEDVEVSDQADGGVINANFTVPVQYIKHFPSKPTKILQIYLRLTGNAATDNRNLVERRAVRAPPDSKIPLLDVIYKGDGVEGPHLVMRFSKPVSVSVSQGKDNRSVQIAVPGTSPEPAIPSPPRGAQKPSPPEIVASPVSPRSGEPSAQRKVPEKPPTIVKGENRYAVTLAMSFDADTDIENVQENLSAFSDYTIYQITSTLFGVEVYLLRLGFFATPEEAEVIKEKVRAQYPVAWVTLITADEHKIAIQNKKRKPVQPEVKLAETPTPVPPIPARPKLDKIYPYIINLESTLVPDTPTPKALPPGLEQYRLYIQAFNKDGETGQRLRLGFFENKQDAEQIRQRIIALYPEAWIDVISSQERHDSANNALVIGDPKFARREPKDDIVIALKGDADQMMTQGRDALTRGDNVKAIRIFTKILSLPQNQHTQDAQEYLALARERNGQTALAKVEYKLYLKLYSQGEGANRVRQRLANLAKPDKRVRLVELRKPKVVEEIHEWSVFGSLSQDYFAGQSEVEAVGNTAGTESELDQSTVLSHVDLTGRFRNTKYNSRFVFSGNQTRDFLNSDDESEVRSAYFDILNKPRDYFARVGRQSASARGVLSRFDGGLGGYSFRPRWRFNVLAGVPADDIAPESDRRFYGVSVDIGPFANRWNSAIYFIDQEIDGLTDRRAIGAELRFFDPKRSLFSLVDYDIHFGAMNIATVQGSWQPGNSTTLNLLVDYRKTPPLQTSNALLGQNIESIDELTNTNSSSEIKQLAEGSTATSKIYTVGAVHPLTDRFQFGGDITVSNISETDAVGNVLEADGTGDVTTYNTQLIANQLIFHQDISIFAVSHSESDSYTANSLSFIERFPFKRNWRAEVGLKLYDQDNDNGSNLYRITPSLRLYYRGGKNLTFEVEIAQERTKVQDSIDDEDTVRDFVRLGYRRDF
jgi:hypothetical protein